MKYAHILAAVTEERWALHEPKLQAILDFLARQAGGEKLSADEIEARITKDREREVTRQSGSVAILPVRGVIANRMNMMDDISGGTSAEGLSRQFQAMMSDDGVKAIILDVDSPGGAVSGTVEFASLVAEARGRKPIVAHVNATAASAAYWIASAAEELVVTPSGMVGSIGVFGVHDDLSGAMDKLGVKKTLISAGKFKTAGNPYQPLDDDTRSRMQARVDEAYDMFVKAVASNRNVTQTAVREGFGQGDMVTAQAALAEGMVDRVATLEETLQRFGASQYAPSPKRRATAFAPQRERRALEL